jgi:hypothetical protein
MQINYGSTRSGFGYPTSIKSLIKLCLVFFYLNLLLAAPHEGEVHIILHGLLLLLLR